MNKSIDYIKNIITFNKHRSIINTFFENKKEDYDDDEKTNDLIEIIADLNYKLNTPRYLDNNLSFVNIEKIIKLFDKIIDILNKYIVVDENTINENINNSLKKTILQITDNLIIKIQGFADSKEDIELLDDIKTKVNKDEYIKTNINEYINIKNILEKYNYILNINNNIQNATDNIDNENKIENLLSQSIKKLKQIDNKPQERKKVTFNQDKNINNYVIPSLSFEEKSNLFDTNIHNENYVQPEDDMSEKTLENTKTNTSLYSKENPPKLIVYDKMLNELKKTPIKNGGKKTRKKRTLKPQKMRIKNKTKKARTAKRK